MRSKQFLKVFFVYLLFFATGGTATPQAPVLKGGPMGIARVAAKANYSVYRSADKASATDTCWIQVDLGHSLPVEEIRLFPVVDDSWDHYARPRFPLRFRIDASEDPTFRVGVPAVDCTGSDHRAAAVDQVDIHRPMLRVNTRYVRLTVTKLPEFNGTHCFDLWRFEVWSGGRNVAEGRTLSDSDRGYLGKHPLLRPARPMGEYAKLDCPQNVTDPASWQPVAPALRAPRGGVVPRGLFEQVLRTNADYLLNSFSVNDMLKDFRITAGKPPGDSLRDLRTEWVDILPGSMAGRFLMGAGNQLRWIENGELRGRMNRIVDGIEACRRPDGYLLGYPENEILFFENGAYCRSWLTQGLIEAAIAGNPKAYPMLRDFYDWFDCCPYLPELVRRGGQGRQGVIASTRMYSTPVGVPLDLQVVQRYYQENFWMKQLAERDVDAIWKYPYDRPHCYLILSLESFLDLYMATGDKKYLEAAEGGWELFRDYYEHTGGSISISELFPYPPKSYLLRNGTGELCGNSFWVFLNQRFHLLYPQQEQYVAEIEKSVYNVGIANQTPQGIIYHANLVGCKEPGTDVNTCCEGQGTRLFGALPELIYSLGDGGISVDLFNPSTITWEQDGQPMTLTMATSFPESPDVELKFSLKRETPCKVRIRIPSWCAGRVAVAVNGTTAVTPTNLPGSYVTLDRTWADGDVIRFTLPMTFRLTRYEGAADGYRGKEAYALEYGPLLMALTGDSIRDGLLDVPLKVSELVERLKPVAGKPLHFRIDCGDASLEYKPYYRIGSEEFTCYPFFEQSASRMAVAAGLSGKTEP